jgi:hypothetical protein
MYFQSFSTLRMNSSSADILCVFYVQFYSKNVCADSCSLPIHLRIRIKHTFSTVHTKCNGVLRSAS